MKAYHRKSYIQFLKLKHIVFRTVTRTVIRATIAFNSKNIFNSLYPQKYTLKNSI